MLGDERIRKLFDETKYNTRNTIYGDEKNWASQEKLTVTKHTKSENPVRALLPETSDICAALDASMNTSKPNWMSFDNPDRYKDKHLTG